MSWFNNVIHKIEHVGGEVVHEVQHEFHKAEDHAKSEATQKALHKALTELKQFSHVAENLIPDVELDIAFVSIGVSGLGIRNSETNKTGLERIIQHFSYWSKNFHWSRNDVRHFIVDLCTWEPTDLDITFTLNAEVDIPILGEVGAQATWHMEQIEEAIDEICDRLGV